MRVPLSCSSSCGACSLRAQAARVSLLGALQSNGALASALASYHQASGDWRTLVRDLERVEGLGAEEVRGVVARYLIPSNCYKGVVLPLNVGKL